MSKVAQMPWGLANRCGNKLSKDWTWCIDLQGQCCNDCKDAQWHVNEFPFRGSVTEASWTILNQMVWPLQTHTASQGCNSDVFVQWFRHIQWSHTGKHYKMCHMLVPGHDTILFLNMSWPLSRKTDMAMLFQHKLSGKYDYKTISKKGQCIWVYSISKALASLSKIVSLQKS